MVVNLYTDHVCTHAYMVTNVSWYLRRPEEGIWSINAEIMGDCELSDMIAKNENHLLYSNKHS